jgi:Na+-transporting methylmalonyl-CoA/oxaloacetate decarboxylase gamma subunit
MKEAVMVTHTLSLEAILVSSIGLAIILLFLIMLAYVALFSDDKNDAKSE